MSMRLDRAEQGARLRKMAMATLLVVFLAACGASLDGGGTALTETTEPKLGVGSGDASAPKASPSQKTQTGTAATATRTAASGGKGDLAAMSKVERDAVKTADGFIAASTPGNTAYKIGPQDVLEVSVFQAPELSRTAQVSDAGSVGLPLVGELPAVGKTAQEVERDLARTLKAKFMQNPQVTVFVKEFNSQRVTIEGAVKKTGVFPLRGKTSLLQAMSMAEGLSDSADTNVVVFRQSPQGRMGARFDLASIRAGTTEDPLIQAGDVIVVGTSFWKEQFNNFTKVLPLASAFALLL